MKKVLSGKMSVSLVSTHHTIGDLNNPAISSEGTLKINWGQGQASKSPIGTATNEWPVNTHGELCSKLTSSRQTCVRE